MQATARYVTSRLSVPQDLLISAIGLGSEAISSIKFIRRASCGLPWHFVQLDSAESVKAIKPTGGALYALAEALREAVEKNAFKEVWPDGLVVFAVTPSSHAATSVYTRVVFQQQKGGSMVEDPATGSAALGYAVLARF